MKIYIITNGTKELYDSGIKKAVLKEDINNKLLSVTLLSGEELTLCLDINQDVISEPEEGDVTDLILEKSEKATTKENEFNIVNIKDTISDIYSEQSYGNEISDHSKSYTTRGKSFTTSGLEIDDEDWSISDYIKIDREMIVTTFPYEDRVAIVTYDKEYNVLNTYTNDNYVKGELNKFERKINRLDGNYVRYLSFGTFDDKKGYVTYKKNYLDDIKEINNTLDQYREDIYFNYKVTNEELEYTNNKKIVADYDNFEDNSNWCISDFIDISKGANIVAYNTSGCYGVIFYDESKQVVDNARVDTLTDINESLYSVTVQTNKGQYAYCKVSSCKGFNAYANVTTILNIKDMLNKQVTTNYKLDPINDTYHFTVKANKDFSTYSETNNGNEVLDTENLVDVQCVVKLPSTYSSTGKPSKVLLSFHGSGDIVSETEVGQISWMCSKLLEEGYVLVDCNGLYESDSFTTHKGMNMGSSFAVESYKKAIDYVIQNFNVEDKVYIDGKSMGGLTALNFVNKYSNIVKCVGLQYPVTDIYKQAWLNPWNDDVKKRIAELYNFDDKTGNTFEENKVVGFNPINTNSVVIGENRYNFFNVPIKIWHGQNDAVVSIEGSRDYIKALRNTGIEAYLREVDDFNHTYSENVLNEEVIWFNRH